MSYVFEHTKFGFCWWDLVALIILIVVAVIFIYKFLKMKKVQQDLEDRISEIYSDEADQEAASPQT